MLLVPYSLSNLACKVEKKITQQKNPAFLEISQISSFQENQVVGIFHGASPFQVAIAKLAEVERSSKSERERMRAEVEQEIEVEFRVDGKLFGKNVGKMILVVYGGVM